MLLPRVLSAVVGIPAGVFMVWLGGWWFAGFVILLALVGMCEFTYTLRAARIEVVKEVAFPCLLALLVCAQALRSEYLVLALQALTYVLVLGSLGFHLFVPTEGSKITSVGATVLGTMYVSFFGFTLWVRNSPGTGSSLHGPLAGWDLGARYLLLVLCCTWALDSGAYFVGRSLGKHKLCPTVSPGKTVEGSVGGAAAAVLIGVAFGRLLFGLPLAQCLVLGALVGVLGQVGDLSKSLVKRDVGVKDFGSLIPGHGGVLDRFDSLLASLPAVYFYLTAVNQ